MPEYIVHTRDLCGSNEVINAPLKHARNAAQMYANMHRTPIFITGRGTRIIFPERPTFAEFIGAARKAITGNYPSEMWLKHMYTGRRNVFGCVGYLRMVKEGKP